MKKALEVINELKDKSLIKDYAIGGAIGVMRWVEPFFTRDLDIFVIPREEVSKKEVISFLPIYDYLKHKGYNEWVGQWIMVEGVAVEFLPAEDLAKEGVENAREIKFEDVKTRVMTPEYLIALLLKAGRDKDIRKIEMLLHQTEVDRNKLRKILLKYNLTKKFKKFR
ncbi:MAG: nucleotidyltransferase [bacterium]